MFAVVRELRSKAKTVAAQLDPHALTPADAAAALQELAAVEKLVCGARLRIAARAAQSNAWRQAGDRTPAHWLSRLCGISMRDASAMIRTAEQLNQLPATDHALSHGELSAGQAGEIADAASAAPAAERDLLDAAEHDGWAGLKAKAKTAKAAAAPDPETGRQKAHARRSYTTWTEGQEWFARINTSVDQGARIEAYLRAFFEQELEKARQQGRREKLPCYFVDALETMARAAHHHPSSRSANADPEEADDDGDGDNDDAAPSGGPKVTLILLATLAAVRRGHLSHGEICEIDGIGPVPLEVARRALGDAALSIVVTDGVDVRNVTRHSRHWSPEQRTALLVRDRTCVIPGCNQQAALEIHHMPPYEQTHHSRIDEAARLCAPDHDRITHQGFQLARRPDGTYQLLTPDQVAARHGSDPPDLHLSA